MNSEDKFIVGGLIAAALCYCGTLGLIYLVLMQSNTMTEYDFHIEKSEDSTFYEIWHKKTKDFPDGFHAIVDKENELMWYANNSLTYLPYFLVRKE